VAEWRSVPLFAAREVKGNLGPGFAFLLLFVAHILPLLDPR
jgi:hypothetical protein